MSNRKISDYDINQAYNDIMHKKYTLNGAAKKLTIDRGTLKKYIEAFLNENKMDTSDFNIVMSENYRGNGSGEGRKGRNKKEKSIKSKKFLENKKKLEEMGIDDVYIQQLLSKLRKKDKTTLFEDTLVAKLLEAMNFFKKVNEGIPEESEAYFSIDDIKRVLEIHIIIISGYDFNSTLTEKYDKILKEVKDKKSVNEHLKRNFGLFTRTTSYTINNIKKRMQQDWKRKQQGGAK